MESGDLVYHRVAGGGWGSIKAVARNTALWPVLRDLHLLVVQHVDPVILCAVYVARKLMCSHGIVMEYLYSCRSVV